MAWIHDEIEARGGAVPFDVFMELALYHARHGYYSGDRPRYGRDGDFLTAPSASPWYARVVARLINGAAGRLGPLRLFDIASGDGTFIADVLDAAAPDALAEAVSVERSQAMRRLQRERFAAAGSEVVLAADLEDIDVAPMAAVVHASELYDALPVVRVVGRTDGARESWVTAASSARLGWEERPTRPEVTAYLKRHGVALEAGQIADINLAAESVHRRVLQAAGGDGVAVVLDYGYETRRLFDPRGRRFGSLATFCGHRVGRDPLADPGEVDLTAHVNWDDLRAAAECEGWLEIGRWPLAEFLVRGGLADELEERGLGMDADLDAETLGARQEIKRLLDPDGMGSDLKVLVQATGGMVDVARSALALNSEFGIRNSE